MIWVSLAPAVVSMARSGLRRNQPGKLHNILEKTSLFGLARVHDLFCIVLGYRLMVVQLASGRTIQEMKENDKNRIQH